MSGTGGQAATAGETRIAAAALLRRAAAGDGPIGPHLVVRPGEPSEEIVALHGEVLVGREAGAGVRLRDPRASRRHALLRLGEDGAVRVEDLSSRNGVRLNGRRVGAAPVGLAPGDLLVIGGTRLRFEDPLAGDREAGPVRPARPAATGRGAAWLTACAALALAAAALLLP